MRNAKLLSRGKVLLTTHVLVKEKSNKYRIKKRSDREKTELLKRLSLNKLMDLKIDYAFKQLFGNEKNKKITLEFLNAILQKSERCRIKDLEFINIELGREYSEDKESRLDLLVLTDTNEKINVEIQFANKYDTVNRSLYYWSGVYRSNLKKGMEYIELYPVIAINILNYDMMKEIESFHSIFHLRESRNYRKLTNMAEFHFIEMPKLLKAWKAEKLDPWNDVLARWLLLLGMVDSRNNKVYDDIYTELEAIAMKDEVLQDAFSHWHDLSLTEEEFLAYEARLKRILDEEAYRTKIARMERRVEKLTEEYVRTKEEAERAQEKAKKAQEKAKKAKEEVERTEEEVKRAQEEVERRKEEVERRKEELERGEQVLEQDRQEVFHQQQLLKQREVDLQNKFEQIVINLTRLGISGEELIKSTGLSKQEITEIQAKMDE